MSETLPTVRIVSHDPGHHDGFVEINERDFDPLKHVLFEPTKPETKRNKQEPQNGKKQP